VVTLYASSVIQGVFNGSDLIKEAGGNVVVVVIQYRLGVPFTAVFYPSVLVVAFEVQIYDR